MSTFVSQMSAKSPVLYHLCSLSKEIRCVIIIIEKEQGKQKTASFSNLFFVKEKLIRQEYEANGK
jgi:hypothetical protein